MEKFIDRYDRFTLISPCCLYDLPALEILLKELSLTAIGLQTASDLSVFINEPLSNSLIAKILELHDINIDDCNDNNIYELLFDPGLIQRVNGLLSHENVSEDILHPAESTIDVVNSMLCNLVAVELVKNLEEAIALAKTESGTRISSLIKIRYNQLHPEIEEKKKNQVLIDELLEDVSSGNFFDESFMQAMNLDFT